MIACFLNGAAYHKVRHFDCETTVQYISVAVNCKDYRQHPSGKMRLPLSLVFSLLIGAAQAASETAKVYIFQEPELPISSTIPILTPEDARLVIAQRLGVSRYHSLSGVSNDALAHINAFGGPQSQLFINDNQGGRSQLVLLIDNVTLDLAIRYEKEWAPNQPAFKISNPPSRTANRKLVRDLYEQNPLVASRPICTVQENVNPFNEECWAGKFKILHFEAINVSYLSS